MNLARKAISDLGAQLAGQLPRDQKIDIETINDYAEKALNVIMDWRECCSVWDDVMQLDLAKSVLSKGQQMKFSSISEAPPTEVQHENPDKLANQKSQNK